MVGSVTTSKTKTYVMVDPTIREGEQGQPVPVSGYVRRQEKNTAKNTEKKSGLSGIFQKKQKLKTPQEVEQDNVAAFVETQDGET